MKYFVVADTERVDGFSCLGVDGIAVHDENQARGAVERALKDKAIGTLLVSSYVYDCSKQLICKHETTGVLPVVVRIV